MNMSGGKHTIRGRVFAAAMLIGMPACSGGTPAEESRDSTARADSTVTVAAVDHGTHQTADSAGAPAPGTAAGMDHSTMPGHGAAATGTGAGSGHAGHPGAATAAPSAAGDAAHSAGHSGPATPAARAHAGHEMAAAPARSGAARAAASERAAMDHASMPGMQHGAAPSSPAPGGGAHAGHAAPEARRAAAPAARSASARAEPIPADSATAKLFTLVRELVRDSVVQARIARDPALREAWTDPDVREIITEAPVR